MKVYVVINNNGYEGYSTPKGAYLSLSEAEAWLKGVKDGYGIGPEVFEFELGENK